MRFGQILKNVLDKNQQVWIPTIGLLAYDKATSKLNLDPYDSASDADLLSLISDIKQVSLGEAKGILIQEVEVLKSSIRTDGKFSIDGVGDILFLEGSYQFESKKTIFPTNFFDKGNFNPNTFSNNTPPVKEEINTSPFESQFIKIETPKKEVEKVEEIEKLEPIKESTDLFSSQLDNLIREVRNEEEIIPTPEPIVEESIDDKIEHQEDIVYDTTSEIPSPLPIIEEEGTDVDDSADKNFNLTSEEEFDAHYLPEEEVESIDNSIASEDFAIQHVEEKIDEIIIDEPRRNIGRSRYDDGYYHYSGSLNKEGNHRWKLVGIISIGIILFGLLGAYIASKFFVKKNDKKVDSTTIVQKVDTTAKIDTTKMLASIDSTTKKDTSSTSKSTLSANKTATTTPSLVSETKSTQPTQNKNNKNTPPKTPSSDNISKKSVAVATKSTETKEETKPVVASKAAKSDKKETNPSIPKDTSTKKSQKIEKINIIGKPYATANYTKGNYYLSFGKFKIASAAAKLKKDMKQKAGVETDIILLDGAYRVVIPYVNKEKAQTAAQDFPSTTLFE